MSKLIDLYNQIISSKFMQFVRDLSILGLRIPIALVFWKSGRTKVDGWNIFSPNEGQIYLFENKFNLPAPELMATLAAIGEHVLPVMLIVGFWTRIGAAGLLVMTAVIQLFVFPDAWWSTHMFWAAILFAIIGVGPGRLSLDYLLTRNK